MCRGKCAGRCAGGVKEEIKREGLISVTEIITEEADKRRILRRVFMLLVKNISPVAASVFGVKLESVEVISIPQMSDMLENFFHLLIDEIEKNKRWLGSLECQRFDYFIDSYTSCCELFNAYKKGDNDKFSVVYQNHKERPCPNILISPG
jgi:hypothetical protein